MKYQSLFLCAVLCFMLGGSPPLLADDPVTYVLPRSAPHVTIPYAQLVDTDPMAVAFQSAIDPSRGSLAVANGQLVYSPDDAFRKWGTDNFQFTYLDLTTGNIHEIAVHLTADFTADSENSPRDTTSGGNTVLDLKIPPPCQDGDCDFFGAPPILLAEGSSIPSLVSYSIWQRIEPDLTSSYQVEAVQVDGSKISTGFIPRDGHSKLRLDWWLSGGRSRNGGFFLRLDDTIVASVSGLDNHLVGIEWEYYAQYVDSFDGLNQHRKHYSHADIRPIGFPVRLTDTFEDNSVAEWPIAADSQPTTSALAVSANAAVDGNLGIRVDLTAGGAALIDERPTAQNNFRARFHLNIGPICTVPPTFRTGSVELLAGRGTLQNSTFTLLLERTPVGGYQLRATSFDDGSFNPTTSTLAITKPHVMVDLTWWAATKPGFPGGGLRVLLFEDVEPGEPGEPIEVDLLLSNGTQRLGSVQFGAVGPGSGAICLDEYESWWQ